MSDTLFMALFAALLPVALCISFYTGLRGHVYEMDWGSDRGSFFAPYALFRRFYYVIFGDSVILSWLCAYYHWPIPAVLFAASGIQAILFNGWTAYCYESYLHSKYPKNLPARFNDSSTSSYIGPSNYTGFRYAVTLSLAYSAVVMFVLGMIDSIKVILER